MNDWLKQLAEIKEEVEQKLSYPYLRKFIEDPFIDEDRVLSLMLPFNHKLAKPEVIKYITTAMLIQIALDTHDKVSNQSDYQLKKQQLTVLAGDYYSGLYYQILAGQEDILLIRILAESIRDINENKIAIYQSELQSVDSLMSSIYKVESGVIERFYSFFEFDDYFPLVSNWFYLKRLVQERNRFSSGESSLLFHELRKLKFPKVKDALSKDQCQLLIGICDQYIDHTKQSMEAELANDDSAIQPISGRIGKLLAEEPLATKLNVEEG